MQYNAFVQCALSPKDVFAQHPLTEQVPEKFAEMERREFLQAAAAFTTQRPQWIEKLWDSLFPTENPDRPSNLTPPTIDATIIEREIDNFSSVYRRAGTQGHAHAFDYIEHALKSWGYHPVHQQSLTNAPLFTSAILPGKNPDARPIIICAHFDALSPGADDNGTGIVALLEMARQFAVQEFDSPIIFIPTGDEEDYGLGILAALKHLRESGFALDKAYLINIDTIGQFNMQNKDVLAAGVKNGIEIRPVVSEDHPPFGPLHPEQWGKIFSQPLAKTNLIRTGHLRRTDAEGAATVYGLSWLEFAMPEDMFDASGIPHTGKDNPKIIDFDKTSTVMQMIARGVWHLAVPRAQRNSAKPWPEWRESKTVGHDYLKETKELFARFGLGFEIPPSTPDYPTPTINHDAYLFFVQWLKMLKDRWPSYGHYFRGMVYDPTMMKLNDPRYLRTPSGFIRYTSNLGVAAKYDILLTDTKFNIKYMDRAHQLLTLIGELEGVCGTVYDNTNLPIFAPFEVTRNKKNQFLTYVGYLGPRDFANKILYGRVYGTHPEEKLIRRDSKGEPSKLEDLTDSAAERESRMQSRFITLGIKVDAQSVFHDFAMDRFIFRRDSFAKPTSSSRRQFFQNLRGRRPLTTAA